MSPFTTEEVLELARLAPTTDVPTGGRVFSIGSAKSYRLARAGEFPVPVLKIGNRYRIRTADLVRAVLGTDAADSSSEPAAATSRSSAKKNGVISDETSRRN